MLSRAHSVKTAAITLSDKTYIYDTDRFRSNEDKNTKYTQRFVMLRNFSKSVKYRHQILGTCLHMLFSFQTRSLIYEMFFFLHKFVVFRSE